MKLTRHNGRSGKNGTYNPKHNDRCFDIANSDHIDQVRSKQNVYWDCYQGYRIPAVQAEEDEITYSFEKIEQAFYAERYSDFCEGQHERNRKSGHSGRDRTTADLWADKKTCPEETLIQIGTIEQSVPATLLTQIAAEFFEEFDRRFGEHIHILDWALHLDEGTPHIHERHVFDCENRYGEIAPQQEKALEALGFDLPNPERKPGKMNNRKMTFDAACRALLFDICRKHGLHLDEEPEYGGRAYLEKQDYILMKQKEKLAAQEKQIEAKEAELEEITILIEDTEAFVEEVAETAYEKAVEVIAGKVRDEARNEDFEIIADKREEILNGYTLKPDTVRVIETVFSEIMKQFMGMTQHISDRLASIFRSPEKKVEIKAPIKESVRDRLARSQRRADELNARRRLERGQLPKKKSHDMEL